MVSFVNYIGRFVYITLAENFYYKGKIVFADENGLKIIDTKGRTIYISNEAVLTLREVENG